MSTEAVNRNKWDDIYSRTPNFEALNNKLPLDAKNIILVLTAAGAGLFLSKDTPNLASKVFLYSALGALLTKGILMAGAAFQRAVLQKTHGALAEKKNKSLWGILAPPRNPQLFRHVAKYRECLDKIINSFPESDFIMRDAFRSMVRVSNDPGPPKPETYSYHQLEQECDQWMESSLQIANAVREDLKYWSDQGTFTAAGNPLRGADLLTRQHGGDRTPNKTSYLYRGFFDLPRAYRIIFNLDSCTEGMSKLREAYQDHEHASLVLPCIDGFEKSYPASNKEILKGWKDKFFQPGTKQYAWREKYNKAMKEIIDLAGGPDAIRDTRFTVWGASHREGDLNFKRSPVEMPT